MKYVICYKELKTGKVGKGSFKYSKKVAEEAARVFNKHIAGSEYWVEPAEKEGEFSSHEAKQTR